MKFILTFDCKTDIAMRTEAIARFQRGEGQPPKGIKLLGRWTRADFGGGFDLLEGDDPKALAEFALRWNDIMELNVYPVLEDAELADVLQRTQPGSATQRRTSRGN